MPWKSRSKDFKFGDYYYLDARFGNTTPEVNTYKTTVSQTTYSEEHEWPGASLTNMNVGGPFYTEKHWVDIETDELDFMSGIPGRAYIKAKATAFLGTLGFGETVLGGVQYGPTADSTLTDLAGPIIKGMSPTASEANMAQAIGELRRDGLPRLIGADVLESRARDFRSYGDEYLNTEFGWLPFVSDIHDFAHAVKHHHKILQQFKRDSGRVIRRRANLPEDGWQLDTDEGGFYASPLNGDFWQVINRPARSMITVRRKRWVVAAYSYYAATGDTILGKMGEFSQKADKLLGISLTPETLWELAPWSWAVDWFSNVGNNISMLSDMINFGPVLRYAYVMETTVAKRTYYAEGFIDAAGHAHSYFYRFNRTTKVRLPASPFTFANVSGPLTGQQQAIIAALGASHAPH